MWKILDCPGSGWRNASTLAVRSSGHTQLALQTVLQAEQGQAPTNKRQHSSWLQTASLPTPPILTLTFRRGQYEPLNTLTKSWTMLHMISPTGNRITNGINHSEWCFDSEMKQSYCYHSEVYYCPSTACVLFLVHYTNYESNMNTLKMYNFSQTF